MKKIIKLDGIWDLQYFKKSSSLINQYIKIKNIKFDYKANVPGDVHIDMVREGVIKEPLYDRNFEKCRWMENCIWIYRKRFFIEKDFLSDRVEIIFEGIDTYAEIFVNGKFAGLCKNAFIQHSIDITRFLVVGENFITIKLTAGLELARGKNLKKYLATWYDQSSCLNERIWIRKPQFVFKWDWCPRLITCGIYRSVKIISYTKLSIRNVYIRSVLKNKFAELFFEIELENFTEKSKTEINIKLKCNKNKHIKKITTFLDKDNNLIKTKLKIPNPQLWWPSPLGKQNLYDVIVELKENNNVLDKYTTKTGIREIKIIQEKLPEPEGGKSFTFSINNKKIFAKGANWVPADSIFGRVSKEKYITLLKLARDANFNMLRVWGGGIYENDIFYSLCDKYGIMLWHDFMFACALYPDDDKEFIKEIIKESSLAIKRLRNHPSIVLWCGNNENDWHWHKNLGFLFKGAKKFYGKKIYHNILPAIVKKNNPEVPYRPSSPYGGENPNSENEGDSHIYFYSNYGGGLMPTLFYEDYRKTCPKFVSEYGTSGSISLRSLKKSIPEKKLKIGSLSLYVHTNGGKNLYEYFKKKINIYLRENVDNLTLPDIIVLSQYLQAETLKYAIEHFRRRKYNTGGSLFWKFADAWPETGDTIIDYYLEKKPAYYFVKKAYEHLHVSIKEEEYGVSVWIINDFPFKIEGILECRLQEFSGKIIKLTRKRITVPADISKIFLEDRVEPFSKNCFYYARFIKNKKIISENKLFFGKIRQINIPEPKLKYKLLNFKNKKILKITTDVFALCVWIDLPEGVDSSDNYFDILPAETKIIEFTGKLSKLKKIKIHTLKEKLDRVNKFFG